MIAASHRQPLRRPGAASRDREIAPMGTIPCAIGAGPIRGRALRQVREIRRPRRLSALLRVVHGDLSIAVLSVLEVETARDKLVQCPTAGERWSARIANRSDDWILAERGALDGLTPVHGVIGAG